MVLAGVVFPSVDWRCLEGLEPGRPRRNEQVSPDCATYKLDDIGRIVEPLNPNFLICTMGCS